MIPRAVLMGAKNCVIGRGQIQEGPTRIGSLR